MANEDPRDQEFVNPNDHPSPISNYPAIVGDGQSGIEARDKRFIAALKDYLRSCGSVDEIAPVEKIHGRGPGIDIRKTLALEVYINFPDKEKWL